jgi:hypothetical protein
VAGSVAAALGALVEGALAAAVPVEDGKKKRN